MKKNNLLKFVKILTLGFIFSIAFILGVNKVEAKTVNLGSPTVSGNYPNGDTGQANVIIQRNDADYWFVMYKESCGSSGACGGNTLTIQANLPSSLSGNYTAMQMATESFAGKSYGNDDEGNEYLNGSFFSRIGESWCDGPVCPSSQNISYFQSGQNNVLSSNIKDYAGGNWGGVKIFKLYKKSIPSAPSISIVSNCYSNSRSVTLSWATVAGAVSYQVYRNGSYLTTTSSATYVETLDKTNTYSYTVKACNANGCSALSNTVSSPSCGVPSATPTSTINQVTLYQDGNYGGSSYTIANPNVYCTNLPWYINDWTSSLRVPSGANITLWENGGCTGRSWTYYGNTPYLESGANDQFSAYGWSVPMPSNLSFSVSSSCNTSNCQYQNNTIYMYASNTTYYRIMYWNGSSWQYLATSYANYYVDSVAAGTDRFYLVEAWNSVGYTGGNPQYQYAPGQSCTCSMSSINLTTSRDCTNKNDVLSWNATNPTPDRYEVYQKKIN